MSLSLYWFILGHTGTSTVPGTLYTWLPHLSGGGDMHLCAGIALHQLTRQNRLQATISCRCPAISLTCNAGGQLQVT